MSDSLKHECGVAVVRLRKPLQYYYDKYGTALWGFNKLMLLMEKQHNRGHDGVGMGCVKLEMPLGEPYIFRRRDATKDSLGGMFRREMKKFNKMERNGLLQSNDPTSIKERFEFGGEVLMGHLRYGTSGEFSEGSCHPYLRRSNWPTRTLLVLGNFNMTNAGELNSKLIDRGQHPIFGTDTQTVLEEVGFHLDEAHSDIYRRLRDEPVDGQTRQDQISKELNIGEIVAQSAESWDGGYTIAGVVGNGDLFVTRDPRGIRPCFTYMDDEVIAFASERVPLMTVFEAEQDDVTEVEPGAVVTVRKDGTMKTDSFHKGEKPSPCSFERIYFSRGNDPSIYKERKAMGAALVPQIIESMGGADFDNAVFSFIPNTAETAYYGLMDGLRHYRRNEVKRRISEAAANGEVSDDLLDEVIMRNWPRGEKVAHKDIKMRTFISQEKGREQLVSHVYDITYGVVGDQDSLVVLDDSIVRGTTLKKSILKILARTKPAKIVICSTAPQIRYPDCYGIDMSELGKFIAFRAAESLRKKRGEAAVMEEVYNRCLAEIKKPAAERVNAVQGFYEGLSAEDISAEVALLVTPEDLSWSGKVEVIFQTIENLHESISQRSGDWYFTGEYPTAGGVAVANMAYINWFEGKSGRSYDLPI